LALSPAVTASTGRSGGGKTRTSAPAAGTEERNRAEERILAVIGNRLRDPKVLERVRGKLAELDPRDVRLASSLCARIAADGHAARADIAFTIIAALLILS
jgi:hypothetical protein